MGWDYGLAMLLVIIAGVFTVRYLQRMVTGQGCGGCAGCTASCQHRDSEQRCPPAYLDQTCGTKQG